MIMNIKTTSQFREPYESPATNVVDLNTESGILTGSPVGVANYNLHEYEEE